MAQSKFMLIQKFIFIICILCLFVVSCNNSKSKPDDAVARVNDKYLTKKDILKLSFFDSSFEDSAAVVEAFIDKWIREQIIVNTAEKNLPDDKKDFETQLEAYRNSLIVFTYESELIRQKLDTSVSEYQIREYYEQNPAEFVLKDNIVKVIFVKLPADNSRISVFKNLILSEKPHDKTRLENEAKRYAANYFLDDNVWLLFDDLIKEVPIKTYNQEAFLKNNRFIEIKDADFYYLVNIKGFMIKESLSPLGFEKERIRNIIVNKRKVDLIKNTHQAIYKEALKNSEFEIY